MNRINFERLKLEFAKTNLFPKMWKYFVRKSQFTQNFKEK